MIKLKGSDNLAVLKISVYDALFEVGIAVVLATPAESFSLRCFGILFSLF
jgi:hypothetical protein